MGFLRKQLEERGGALVERVADSSIAASQRVADSYRGFRQVLAEGEQSGVEAYLTAMVGAVRGDSRDEDDDEETRRDVYVRARKRRRKLGLVCLGTGPMAGVANQVADLYCEIATLCDVAELHDLDLEDSQVTAHMLVLWSIAADRGEAEAIVRGEPPLAQILETELAGRAGLVKADEGWTPRSIATAIWDIQNLRTGVIGDLKTAADGQPVRSVLFTGHRTKKVIARAEAQLGVAPERRRGWLR